MYVTRKQKAINFKVTSDKLAYLVLDMLIKYDISIFLNNFINAQTYSIVTGATDLYAHCHIIHQIQFKICALLFFFFLIVKLSSLKMLIMSMYCACSECNYVKLIDVQMIHFYTCMGTIMSIFVEAWSTVSNF